MTEIVAAIAGAFATLAAVCITYLLNVKSSEKEITKKVKDIESAIVADMTSLYSTLNLPRILLRNNESIDLRIRFLEPAEVFRFYSSLTQDLVLISHTNLQLISRAHRTYAQFFEHTLPLVSRELDERDNDDLRMANTFVIDHRRFPIFLGSLNRCCSDIEAAMAALGYSRPEADFGSHIRWRRIVPRRLDR